MARERQHARDAQRAQAPQQRCRHMPISRHFIITIFAAFFDAQTPLRAMRERVLIRLAALFAAYCHYILRSAITPFSPAPFFSIFVHAAIIFRHVFSSLPAAMLMPLADTPRYPDATFSRFAARQRLRITSPFRRYFRYIFDIVLMPRCRSGAAALAMRRLHEMRATPADAHGAAEPCRLSTAASSPATRSPPRRACIRADMRAAAIRAQRGEREAALYARNPRAVMRSAQRNPLH